VNDCYDAKNLRVYSDRDLVWEAVPGPTLRQVNIYYNAPADASQVVQVYTVDKDGKENLAIDGRIVLAPNQAFKNILPASARLKDGNNESAPTEYSANTRYTPPQSLSSGNQGPPVAEQNVRKGNLISSGISKNL